MSARNNRRPTANASYSRSYSKLPPIFTCFYLVHRSSELNSGENAAVRRLVQGAFQKVVVTGGQSLGEVPGFFCHPLCVHVSDLNKTCSCFDSPFQATLNWLIMLSGLGDVTNALCATELR